jgi:hypothetical protein
MDSLLGLIFLWVIFCLVFAEFAPLVGELLIYLLRFLIECVVIALKTVLKGMLYALGWLLYWTIFAPFRFGLRALKSAVLLGWFLIIEITRGAPPEDEGDEEPDAPEDVGDVYEAACALLGFDPDGTADELKRAYRSMIRRAHPDAGGSAAQTIAVNEARDAIKDYRGWT